jgi:hypothetical protein
MQLGCNHPQEIFAEFVVCHVPYSLLAGARRQQPAGPVILERSEGPDPGHRVGLRADSLLERGDEGRCASLSWIDDSRSNTTMGSSIAIAHAMEND